MHGIISGVGDTELRREKVFNTNVVQELVRAITPTGLTSVCYWETGDSPSPKGVF